MRRRAQTARAVRAPPSLEVSLRVGDWKQLRAWALAVRYAVFVKEQGIPANLEIDEQDALAVHVVALDPCGAPLGTGRLLADGHIGRMAVLRGARGQGIGATLLHTLVAIAKSRGMQQLRLHAQLGAISFYEKEGFTAIGPQYEEAGILHRTMVRHLPSEV
ncbi:MAG TPA: GNAT family N-acetyltransferase [Burkholderiaceae bacterium]|nr:GNAT family N-acetyltransferase [Burkholderiaceae bacterium]